MMRKGIVLLLLLAMLAACGSQPTGISPTNTPSPAATTESATAAPTTEASSAPTAEPQSGPAFSGATLVVMSHDSFNVSEDVVAAFEAETGAKLQVLKSGDTGAALNKAILSKDSPLADVFFGVDNTFLSRALEADIFEAYDAPALANIPAQFKLDPSNRLLPIDYGYVVINYDKGWLAEQGREPPTTLEELTKPEWKDLLVVENPATSSPGLAFMLATIGYFGTEGDYTWLNYWEDLRANGVLVADGWEDAYYTHFSGSSGDGPRPLVVSYATSPAAEVYFSEGTLSEPPTANLMAGAFLQVEFAGILKNTKQRALAERFIDFMLSKLFQEDVPLQMFIYPVLPEAAQPDVFVQFAQVPEQSVGVTPEQIEQNREQWLEEWTRTVLR